MPRASDVIFGKIVVKNQLAAEAAVRECLRALEGDGGRTLADIMVERGLLPREAAEKARHATARLQAERYLKFASELGFLPPGATAAALEELRARGYRKAVGDLLLEKKVLTLEQHALVIARDPRTLDEGGFMPVVPSASGGFKRPVLPATAGAPAPSSPVPAAPAPPPAPPPLPASLPLPPIPPPPPPPGGAVLQIMLRGSAREFAAIALRDAVLTPAELDAALTAAPPAAREDARALADALVAARVLARVHADQIESCAVIERDMPELGVEGYYLVEPLGFTAEGPVIRARRQLPDGQTVDVALEVLTPGLAADPAKFEDFRRRTGAVSAPEHPSLARTVDTGRSGECFYLARELPAGEPLSTRLRARGPLSEREAVDLARAIAGAIGAYATTGLVHGSIRPENIVLSPEGTPILRDIGSTPAPEQMDQDRPPPVADIPRYLAPEQITGEKIDTRTDIYALGIVLFEAVTGRPPYDGASSAEVIAKHLAGQLPDPASFGAKLSPRLSGLLKVMCAAAPAQRYTSADDLLDDLAGLQGGTMAVEGGGADRTVLYGGASGGHDRTMLASGEDDIDLQEMRKAAAERRAREAAAKAGIVVGTGSQAAPVPGAGGDPLVGLVLSGRYRLLKKLGAGGMGSVYQAEHLLLHKIIALKILHPKLLENEEAVRRFDREVKAASRFSHPAITQIFDAGEDQGPAGKLHYMVMEYVEGTDLEKIIQKEGALPLDRVLRLVKQVLSAVDEAHKKGIVHRDMKSDNIMVCKDPATGAEVAKIMDFGIAKIVEGKETSTATALNNQQSFKTRKGVVTGTPQYMSPEQASGDPNIDGRSDIYSIGVILYEMCLGELPFKSNTAMGYLGKHIVEPPIPFKVARPDIDLPKDLERVILKCLEKQKDARYQTAGEMLQDLEATVFPVIFQGVTPGGTPRRRAGGSRKVAIAAVAAAVAFVLLGGGGFAGWKWWQGRRARDRADALQRAGTAIAAGNDAEAKEILAALAEDDPEANAFRERLRLLIEQKTRDAEANAALDKGGEAAALEQFDRARAWYKEAERLRPDERARAALARLEQLEKLKKAADEERDGDSALTRHNPTKALEHFELAAELRGGPSPALTAKILTAKFEAALLRGDAFREKGDEEKRAAEEYREALRVLDELRLLAPLIDRREQGARATARLKETLEAMRLDAEGRRAYMNELLGEAKRREGMLDFRGAVQYYEDALHFADGPEEAARLADRDAARDRAREQVWFEELMQLARAPGVDRREVADRLRSYIAKYDASPDGARPKGPFVDRVREELRRWSGEREGAPQ